MNVVKLPPNMPGGQPTVLDHVIPGSNAQIALPSKLTIDEANVSRQDGHFAVEYIVKNEDTGTNYTWKRKSSSEHEGVSKLQRRGAEQMVKDEEHEKDVRGDEAEAIASRAEESRPLQETKQEEHPFPALVRLAGEDFESYEADTLIAKVLQSIDNAIASNPDMLVRGRTADQFRISYETKNQRPFYIQARMKTLLATKMDYTALDALLSPLLATNPKAFNIEAQKLNTTHQLKNKEWNTKAHRKGNLALHLGPYEREKRHSIAGALLDATRKRFDNNYPQSNLLLDPEMLLDVVDEQEAERIRTWSLHGLQMGLAVTIQECFNDSHRSSEEYYDLVERTLYCFKVANPFPSYDGGVAAYTVTERDEHADSKSLGSGVDTVTENYDHGEGGNGGLQDISEENMWEFY